MVAFRQSRNVPNFSLFDVEALPAGEAGVLLAMTAIPKSQALLVVSSECC